MDNHNSQYIDEDLVSTFIAEAKEQIERLVFILLQIEQQPDRQIGFIDEMFRLAHNLKGTSGIAGLNELKETMHEVENLFDSVRNGDYQLDEDDVDLLLSLTDELVSFLDTGNLRAPFPKEVWVEKIRSCTGVNNQGQSKSRVRRRSDPPLTLNKEDKKTVASWQEAGKQVYGIELHFTDEAPMRSVTALVFIKYLEKYGEILTTAPSREELENEEYSSIKLVLLRTDPLTTEDELKIMDYPTNDGVEGVKIRQWQYRREESSGLNIGRINGGQTIRVEAERIDTVLNQLGKILILKTGLLRLHKDGYKGRASWEEFGKSLQELEQTISALQTSAMNLRMIPVHQIFTRFPKVVRDLAKKCGKKIELHFIGEETEIDKQIAEELVDPLTHLLRNSIDHGIEEIEERKSKGKDPIGHITLDAHQEGGHIVISVRDDGRGLNLEKIRNKAIQNGIIKEEEVLGEEELTRLIFAPGFSTADQVTEVSGRGVGMDVVKTAIKRLQGDIEVKSVPDGGTEFALKVPLTLAIIQSFMVRIGEQIFGIPVGDVVQNIVIKESDIHLVADRLIYYRYPEAIPLIDLASRFGFECERDKNLIPVVIINYGRGRVGYIVEELLGLEEIMIKPINKSMGEVNEISGAALLGNGNIALILDNQALAQKVINL
ncbi:MAG TPA: chemotaxis protein CheA [Bacillota bacterium]